MKHFQLLLKRHHLLRDLLFGVAATVLACGFTAACRTNTHPDNKQAVFDALTSHDLASVMVDQDQGKGIIKLTGVVGSPDRKDSAQQVAQQAAPGYTIDNQIRVEDIGLTSTAQPSGDSSQTTGKGQDTGAPTGAEKTKPQKAHKH
ncbi:MAG TPA: hypothetical protein VGL22_19480 [Terracidiphilus sp.]